MKVDSFKRFLSEYQSNNFYLSAAPGNSGDTLLQTGLTEYLKEKKFTLTDAPKKEDIILMHGGGSIDDVWGTGMQHLEELLNNYPDNIIAVAPSTIHFTHTDFKKNISKHTQKLYIFAREKYTLAMLQALELPSNICIAKANDTAFLLTETKYLEELQGNCTTDYSLYALRTDKESTISTWFHLDHPPQTIIEHCKLAVITYQQKKYLANVLNTDYIDASIHLQDVSYLPYLNFVQEIQRASEVYTDRLHVCILAALLGKPVYLQRTKYQKNQGVYEMTLQAYPNVKPLFS